MNVSVIITTLNEEKNIGRCIKALQAGHPAEIIVVDNNSKDKTVKIAKSLGATVISRDFKTTIFDQILVGFKKAKSQVVLFIYADSIVSPKYIEGVKKAINEGYDGGAFLLRNTATTLRYQIIANTHRFIHELFFRAVWANRGIFVTKKFFTNIFLKEKPIGWWDENLSTTIKKKGKFKFVKCFTTTSFRLYEEMGYVKALFLVLKLYFKRNKMNYKEQTKVLQTWRKK